jgi:hypothetical protein
VGRREEVRDPAGVQAVVMNEEQEIAQHVGRIAQDMMEKIFEPVFGHARKRKLEDEAKLDGVFA